MATVFLSEQLLQQLSVAYKTLIQTLGAWKSDAYRIYIKIPPPLAVGLNFKGYITEPITHSLLDLPQTLAKEHTYHLT